MGDSGDVGGGAVDDEGVTDVGQVAGVADRDHHAFGAPEDGCAGTVEGAFDTSHFEFLGIKIRAFNQVDLHFEEGAATDVGRRCAGEGEGDVFDIEVAVVVGGSCLLDIHLFGDDVAAETGLTGEVDAHLVVLQLACFQLGGPRQLYVVDSVVAREHYGGALLEVAFASQGYVQRSFLDVHNHLVSETLGDSGQRLLGGVAEGDIEGCADDEFGIVAVDGVGDGAVFGAFGGGEGGESHDDADYD